MRILQAFHYKYKELIPLLPKIKEQGFTHIQLSPCTETKEPSREYKDFWLQYQPLSLTIGNSQVGTKKDLIDLCAECDKYGLYIIMDVVLRHCAGSNTNCAKPHELVDKKLLPFIINRPQLFDENNRYDVVHNSTGMPMLDVENKDYQKLVIEFLDELIECGVDMFRLDQYKHYALPEEFENEGTFVTNVMNRYGKNMWIGEVLFEDNKELLGEFTKFAYVFSMNGIDNHRIVRAVECHDTYLNNDGVGYTRSMNDEIIIREYDYLCSYARHTMFYCRPLNNTWMDSRIREINKRHK